MTEAIHPRDSENGTIGPAVPTEEFIDNYLQHKYDTTLDDAISDDGFLSRLF